MTPELYEDIQLTRAVPEAGLSLGDQATLIEYLEHPQGGEPGAVLELSQSSNHRQIFVVTVPASAIAPLTIPATLKAFSAMWTEIAQQISRATGQAFEISDRTSISGGCINQAYRVSDGVGQSYFLKVNSAGAEAMFAAEALGLKQMAAAQAIRVPRPMCYGSTSSNSFIVLEDLDLSGRGGSESWAEMGRQLARLHRLAISDKGFGWDRNNTIGDTPQINDWTASWAEFWTEHRIGYQLKLAARRGGRFEQGDRLLEQIPMLLNGHEPDPSLVHGDLWSGNAAVTADGTPVIFDPAAYYGDREVDLAMTELFGAFPAAFYQAYKDTWPLAPGHQQRKTLYNLYHILNHFNLFGGGYASQANQMISQLLR